MLLASEQRAALISRTLREGDGDELSRRRAIIGLSLLSAGVMGVVAAYQTGLIKRLPEPAIPGLDAERVNGSAEAYRWFHVPDALLGLGSYALTAILAAAAGQDRPNRLAWLPMVLAGKALLDAAAAAKLTWDQWAKHRAFCLYCLIAAACTFLVLPLTLPDARAAVRRSR